MRLSPHFSREKQENGDTEYQTPECENKQASAGYLSDFNREWFWEDPPVIFIGKKLLGSFSGQKQ